MAKVALKNVWKIYGGRVEAVKGLSLDIKDGEFVSLLGPSGCGKSSTLRMIAGLEEITSGELYMGGQLMNNVRTEDRDVSMVFEYYALLPHMTVYDNIAFPLRILKYPKDEIDKKVREVVEIFGFGDILNYYAVSLSGGQKQQVGMARALVKKTAVLLMDEPISHLDLKLRVAARSELARLQRAIGITTVYVTHDQSEALALSDRIAVMNMGELRQCGTPEEIFYYPEDKFTAGFIGEYPINFIDAVLLREDRKLKIGIDSFKVEIPDYLARCIKPGDWNKVTIGLRPEDTKIYPESSEGRIPVDLKFIERSAEYAIVFLEFNKQEILAQTSADVPFDLDTKKVYLDILTKDTKFFDKETEKTILLKSQDIRFN